jgi:UDP-N-acetylmuramoyl-L-alanyl-D-glutamate--2,6-diaminopimelate ligase
MGRGGVLLDDLLAGAPGIRVRRRVGPAAVRVSGISHDSRTVRAGDLYCCLRGERVDGHDFAPRAVDAGASALLAEREIDVVPSVAQVLVEDARVAMAPIAAAFHGRPSEAMTVVGVTGTTGKTTTAHVLHAIFEHAGVPCGVLGTLTGAHTTPEAPELQARLAAFRADGKRAVAMEVSSHALELHRADGTRFAVAVFTNLGRDHLDFHGTTEAYFAAKARLFDPAMSAAAVINADDAYGRRLLESAVIPATAYALADAHDLSVGPLASTFRWRGQAVRFPLGGRFNVSNALAAATAAVGAGVAVDDVVAGLAATPPVPGRFEPVDEGQAFTVLVDFAHTPESLASALEAAREVAGDRRVIVAFGCGGDRDPSKRPAMGEVASRLADVVVVTSDNPRTEDPTAIISGVISGIPPARSARTRTEPDRRSAIAMVLDEAAPRDVVVIAGKGHETTQTIGDEVVAFDDRAVARELLSGRREPS